MTVVKLVNDRDPFVGVNALTLLDCLVKNCGYPFHLQISRKEFLNELVKRFPERPPHKYNKVQRLILTQIEEWNETICKNSRYKKDLGFIRDMHRLLSYKGYIFPEINRSEIAVLNPSDNLKSVEDIQKEERLAQSAKLQELIRRGRPEDLKEANKLMKIMSGFQEDKKLNEMTKQKVAEDISKIKGKMEVFSDMVNNYNEADANSSTNETLEELYSSLKVAQPVLTKIVAEEQDDHEAVADLLKLNDTINLLIEKYGLIKGKDLVGASKINVNASGEANLIDFDDDDDNNANPAAGVSASSTGNNNNSTPQNSDSLIDLLGDLDLSSNNNNNGVGTSLGGLNLGGNTGPISLGPSLSQNTPTPPPQFQANTSNTTAIESFTQLQNLDAISNSPLNQGSPFQQSQALNAQHTLQSNQSLPGGISTNTTGNATIIHTSSNLKIAYAPSKISNNEVHLSFVFSNLSLKNVSNLTFLLAVPKQYKLELNPQSNNFLLAMSSNGITQLAKVTGANADIAVSTIKFKWKVNYKIDGDDVEEQGVYVSQDFS